MLDSISVVIQMTGLLLLTPHGANTHVLLPEPVNLPPHMAVMAFRGDSSKHCGIYNSGICVIYMDGYSAEIEARTPGQAQAPGPLHGAVDLTHASGKPVARQHLGQRPGRKVRSRVSLHGGGISGTCSLAKWRYDPVGTTPEDTIPLANMLEWTIPNIRQDSVLLIRSRLDPEPEDVPDTLVLRPRAGIVEVIIMHDPPSGHEAFARAFRPSPARRRTGQHPPHGVPVAADRIAADSNTVATHFTAYYDLLGARKAAERPLPRYVGPHDPSCSFSVLGLSGQRFRGLGTLNCMVAAARSEP